MTTEEQILQSLLTEDSPGSMVYKKINTFDFISNVETKNLVSTDDFYSNYYTQSIDGYQNSAVNVFYDESCTDDSKVMTLFFGSSTGYGANSNDFTKSKYSDTRAIYSKINYMFDYNLEYENIYAIEFHSNNTFDYMNSAFFQINLASYDGSSVLTENLFCFISSGSSQYSDPSKYLIIPIFSGSLSGGEYSNEEIGLFNPEKNVIVFNADKLDSMLLYNTDYTSTLNTKNVDILYNSLSQSLSKSIENDTFPIVSNGILSNNLSKVSIDVELTEFNYTNNPTFFDKSTNKFRSNYTNTLQNVYFTTIGLYDQQYRLLAVAKKSKPLPKNDSEKYTFEILVQS